MKVTGIRTRPYQFRMTRRLGDANFPEGRQMSAGMVVFVDSDEGITGISIGSPGARSAVHSLEPLIVGKDPRGVKGLWKRMLDAVFKGGNEGVASDAISAIDVALWDLKAKANDEPLWKTLGASTRYVRAYASGIDMPLSDEELAEFYEGMAAKGVSAGKLKVGVDRETDLRRIGIMQDALKTSGKTPQLMVDSNEYWSPKQAIRNIRAFEERFELLWCEEPARRWDYRGLRKVSRSVTAAVATGENLADIKDFMPLIANEAVDVVQIGIGTTGITGLMKVADLAYGFELPVSMMNCPVNFMAPAAAAIPNHMMMEVVDERDAGILSIDSTIEDGYIVLGDAPGLGLAVDEEALERLSKDTPQTAEAITAGRRRGAALVEVKVGEPEDLDE
jgi:L-alanine-DL-glutamate epimerase-like enolase superfamily enzyme